MDDVFRAIDELEFGEFAEPLRQSLGTTRRAFTFFSGVPTAPRGLKNRSRSTAAPLSRSQVSKNAAAKSAQRSEREDKKRKAAENPAAGDEDEGDGDDAEEEPDEDEDADGADE